MPLIDLNGLGHFKDRENAMIAEDFSASKAYAAGDYCYYNGTLYKFKTAHAAGAWTTSDVEAAKLAGDVSSLKESIITKDGIGQVTEENTTFFIRPKNIFNPKTILENQRLDTDGTIYSGTGYATSDYINVEGFTGLKFLFDSTPRPITAFFCFYDENKVVIGTRDAQTSATVPSTAVFIRVSLALAQVGSFMIVDSSETPTAYIEHSYTFKYDSKIVLTPNDDIIQTLLDNAGADIYFESGNYDIIQIYKNKYGDDYFDNYAGYNTSNPADRGLPVLRGTKLSFSQGAYFTAIYEGQNSSVWLNFSAFALERNVVIDGLILNTKDVRNPIHDDFDNYTSGTTIIKNCHITANSLIIAGGFGAHEDVVIENNYFSTTRTGEYDISYHNSSLTNAQSRMIIKDNYLNKGIRLAYYGTSTLLTNIYVTNNSMAYDVTEEAETSSSTTVNISVKKWNNEIRA